MAQVRDVSINPLNWLIKKEKVTLELLQTKVISMGLANMVEVCFGGGSEGVNGMLGLSQWLVIQGGAPSNRHGVTLLPSFPNLTTWYF